MGAQFSIGEEDVDVGVGEDVVHLVGLQEVVNRHHYRAGTQDAEQRGDEFRTILEPQANAFAGFDAEMLREPVSDEEGLAPEIRVRILAVTPEQSDFLRLLLNGFGEGTSQVHGDVILPGSLGSKQGGINAGQQFSLWARWGRRVPSPGGGRQGHNENCWMPGRDLAIALGVRANILPV
jgi:hypothetical protein